MSREVFWHEYAKIRRHASQNAITEGDVTPKPENGVRLQATLGNQNPTGLPVGAVSISL